MRGWRRCSSRGCEPLRLGGWWRSEQTHSACLKPCRSRPERVHARAQAVAAPRPRQQRSSPQPAHRHRGAGVRQPEAQQAAEPRHAQGSGQSGNAVAAVLHGAQHREAGQERVACGARRSMSSCKKSRRAVSVATAGPEQGPLQAKWLAMNNPADIQIPVPPHRLEGCEIGVIGQPR